MFHFLHRYPICNLRFLLRTFSCLCSLGIIFILAYELLRSDDQNDATTQTNIFGIQCKGYKHSLRLPAQMWRPYVKILGLFFGIWLLIKICVLYFPMFYGDWLYYHKEKLYTYRTTVIMVACFNLVPLLLLSVFDCLFAQYFILIGPFTLLTALFIDRIFVRENDYFGVALNGDMDMLSISQWDIKVKKRKPREPEEPAEIENLKTAIDSL